MIKPIDTPLVSIITPLHNAAQFIAQTIASVQAQTYQNWEHIIVDDYSTDNSLEIVASIAASEVRIRMIKLEENKGAAHARNIATEASRGAYIAFLDSDDLWRFDKLEKQLDFMIRKQCAVSYTSYLHIDERGNALGKRVKAMPALSYEKEHRNNYIGNLTGMYNVASLGKILAPTIRKRQDWAVWLEAIKRSGKPALGIQEDLAFYRIRSGSMSANKFSLIKFNYKFYRAYLGYTPLKATICLLSFFWEYFVHRPRWIEELT